MAKCTSITLAAKQTLTCSNFDAVNPGISEGLDVTLTSFVIIPCQKNQNCYLTSKADVRSV